MGAGDLQGKSSFSKSFTPEREACESGAAAIGLPAKRKHAGSGCFYW